MLGEDEMMRANAYFRTFFPGSVQSTAAALRTGLHGHSVECAPRFVALAYC